MNLNDLSKRAHANAVEKGFWQKKHSNEHYLMLVITEIAEMVEADRKNKYANIESFEFNITALKDWGTTFEGAFASNIKDTVEDEFADIAIRLADLAGGLGVDVDNMRTRLCYHHCCELFSFTENAFALVERLTHERMHIYYRIQFGFAFLEEWAQHLGINLEWHIEQKMKYNQIRSAMHGKKY